MIIVDSMGNTSIRIGKLPNKAKECLYFQDKGTTVPLDYFINKEAAIKCITELRNIERANAAIDDEINMINCIYNN